MISSVDEPVKVNFPVTFMEFAGVVAALTLALPCFAIGWASSQVWTGLIAGWITGEKFGEKMSCIRKR